MKDPDRCQWCGASKENLHPLRQIMKERPEKKKDEEPSLKDIIPIPLFSLFACQKCGKITFAKWNAEEQKAIIIEAKKQEKVLDTLMEGLGDTVGKAVKDLGKV